MSAVLSFIIYPVLVKKNQNKIVNTDNANNPEVNSEQIAEKLSQDKKNLIFLLLGYGGAGHDGGSLMDAIQVANIDFDKKKISLISIPRDTYVRSKSGREFKINEGVLHGSQENKDTKGTLITKGIHEMENLVSDLTGLKVDYYMAVDFTGFERSIGIILKGVEVNVGQTLNDPWYPIFGEAVNTCGMSLEEVTVLTQKYSGFELESKFPCRYEHLLFNKGIVKMQGGDALKYVRSRHGSSGGDMDRGRRQQEVIAAVWKKLFTIEALKDIPVFFKEAVTNVQTDVTVDMVKYVTPFLEGGSNYKIVNINLNTSNVLSASTGPGGQAILVSKKTDNSVAEFIKNELLKD